MEYAKLNFEITLYHFLETMSFSYYHYLAICTNMNLMRPQNPQFTELDLVPWIRLWSFPGSTYTYMDTNDWQGWNMTFFYKQKTARVKCNVEGWSKVEKNYSMPFYSWLINWCIAHILRFHYPHLSFGYHDHHMLMPRSCIAWIHSTCR